MSAGSVKAGEIQTTDIYARRIVLVDKDGTPSLLQIGDDGELDIVKYYYDVYVHPGEDFMNILQFAYRYGTDQDKTVLNFAGLTPYETLLNFIPMSGVKSKKFMDRICYSFGSADGKDSPFEKTLLVTVPEGKKISSIKVYDSDGTEKSTIPVDCTTQMLTVNMPSFQYTDDGNQLQTLRIELPGVCPGQCDAFKPFLPPFLAPPKPVIPPLVPPSFGPIPPFPTASSGLGHDIFDDDAEDIGSHGVMDYQDNNSSVNLGTVKDYDVVYEEYSTSTYKNIILKRS